MSLPAVARFPSSNIKKAISRPEWDLYRHGCITIIKQYLEASSEVFAANLAEDSSMLQFLVTSFASYFEDVEKHSQPSGALFKSSFLVVHRTFSEMGDLPPSMTDWTFLTNLSIVHMKSTSLRKLLEVEWPRHGLNTSPSIRKSKVNLTAVLDKGSLDSEGEEQILRAVSLARTCYHYGEYLMEGSDFVDALVTAYDRKKSSPSGKRILVLAYVSLTSLMKPQNTRTSTLLDHLYGLKDTGLLIAMIESSPFLTRFEHHIAKSVADSGRAKPLLEQFAKYKKPTRRRKRGKDTMDKGKARMEGRSSEDAVHVHKMSLVSQIQDLFPDLGSGFIVKLLDEYKNDTEAITAHLLDDRLPAHLKQADPTEVFDFSQEETDDQYKINRLSPRNTPPLRPQRRNIHDDDEVDTLAVDALKLHLGRKDEDLTADKMLAAERPSDQKAAILSALAAFDSDDDERDDTYDVEDVGGTVDTTFGDDEDDKQKKKDNAFDTTHTDGILYRAYKATPDLFKRDTVTRRSQARTALKQETGMTDEAIEGWAIMLSRDPQRRRRMERAHDLEGGSSSGPRQPALESTAWRGADSGTEGGTDSDVGAAAVGGGSAAVGRGRGHRGARGRGGRGAGGGGGQRGSGSVVGSVNERDTQMARQRKDASKGSRANHNRRDQRARKVARAGFAG